MTRTFKAAYFVGGDAGTGGGLRLTDEDQAGLSDAELVAEAMKEALDTVDVAVIIDATHLCVASRGIQDTQSSTRTFFYSGKFEEEKTRAEFIGAVR